MDLNIRKMTKHPPSTELLTSKDYPTLQQNTNHKFGTKLNTDLRETRDRRPLLI